MRFLDVSLVDTLNYSGYVCICCLTSLPDNNNRGIDCVCFSPDGKYLAATERHKVRIYDVATGANNW
jgi:WD40 repeat protein